MSETPKSWMTELAAKQAAGGASPERSEEPPVPALRSSTELAAPEPELVLGETHQLPTAKEIDQVLDGRMREIRRGRGMIRGAARVPQLEVSGAPKSKERRKFGSLNDLREYMNDFPGYLRGSADELLELEGEMKTCLATMSKMVLPSSSDEQIEEELEALDASLASFKETAAAFSDEDPKAPVQALDRVITNFTTLRLHLRPLDPSQLRKYRRALLKETPGLAFIGEDEKAFDPFERFSTTASNIWNRATHYAPHAVPVKALAGDLDRTKNQGRGLRQERLLIAEFAEWLGRQDESLTLGAFEAELRRPRPLLPGNGAVAHADPFTPSQSPARIGPADLQDRMKQIIERHAPLFGPKPRDKEGRANDQYRLGKGTRRALLRMLKGYADGLDEAVEAYGREVAERKRLS